YGRSERESSRYLETIRHSGKHLLSLINDILDLSKVEAGRMEVERIPCAAHRVIAEVVSIMAVKADEKGVFLEMDFADGLPATIETDPARLRQIVTNLVGNALKFTATGGVTVSARIETDASVPRFVLDIADTGIGIPLDKCEAVFEPFVQAETSTTRKFGGTGLGLAISRRFARALGGDIKASSVLGQGSVFSVMLDPGSLDGVEWLTAEQLLAPEAQAMADDSGRWVFPDGVRVLVVDDGNENRELVRLVLQEVGIEVVEAENGQLGLERATQERFDLVLMDLQMPVMDGFAATRAMRDAGLELPVLALTANAMKGYEARIDAAGFSGHLTKPVDIDALLAEMGARLGGVRESAAIDNESATASRGAEPARPHMATTVEPVAAVAFEPPASRAADEPGDPVDEPHGHTPPVGDIASAARAGEASASREPIHSRLATHPRLSKVVRSFALQLPERLLAIEAAMAANDSAELGQLAHWLKGAGGTVGFDEFFEPSRTLEQQAHAGDIAGMQDSLATLRGLAARIVAPDEMPAAAPVRRRSNAAPEKETP
ncbi:MAG: arcB 7, partial [Rhizobacter sp.]|nr:arcB 7 [Rhizobacter sp.]